MPRRTHDLKDLLAQSLHDRSVDDALHDLVRDQHVVGVMGGHALTRESRDYAAAAHLAHSLAAAGRDRRDRWWSRRDGGGQPRRPAGQATGPRCSTR